MDRYAVIGNPIEHSRSPRIHACFAAQTGVLLEYSKLLAPLDDFGGTVSHFFSSGGQGANVTVPFKEQAAGWVDVLAGVAEQALAVNTIFLDRGKRVGTNTDGMGLVRDLEINLGWSLAGTRILVVGAGGASRGVVGPLLERKPDRLHVVNRTPDRAHRLVERFAPASVGTRLSSSGLCDLQGGFDIVINATSAGLDQQVPDLPTSVIAGARCYDMVYGRDTAFCSWARQLGAAAVADGLGMLVEQAAEAFRIWRGVSPDTQPVIAELRAGLGG
ncbi:MAG: shikimate dehydrogenase [Pseudomonadales bacterium]